MLFPENFRYDNNTNVPSNVGHTPTMPVYDGDYSEFDVSGGTANAYRSPSPSHAEIALTDLTGAYAIRIVDTHASTPVTGAGYQLIFAEDIPVPGTAIVPGTTTPDDPVTNGLTVTFGGVSYVIARGPAHLVLSAAQARATVRLYARKMF